MKIALKIKNLAGSDPTTGALLIRNSRGEEWGEGGYGHLPHKYVETGLAEDFWSVMKKDWIDGEGEEKYLGKKIRFLPLWKWLVEG